VKELAEAMLLLANHPQLWESYGLRARQKIESDFNVANQLKKQKLFYDEVIESAGR